LQQLQRDGQQVNILSEQAFLQTRNVKKR